MTAEHVQAYLRTRAQVLAIAEAEAAAADAEPLENLEPLHMPYLVLMPDAKDLCIAQHSAQAEPAAKQVRAGQDEQLESQAEALCRAFQELLVRHATRIGTQQNNL